MIQLPASAFAMVFVTSLRRRVPTVAFLVACAVCLAFAPAAKGQTIVQQETFETDGEGSRYDAFDADGPIATFSDGSTDYFTRTDGSNISGGVSLPGPEGSFFFAGQDVDGEGAVPPVALELASANTSGFSNLTVRALFAEDDDGSNEDWDSSDYLRLQYSTDGGSTFANLICFGGDGSSFNSEPGIDNDCDGVRDAGGTSLTDTFTEFTGSIPGTPSSVILRIEAQLNSGDEDFAIDNIRLEGTSGSSTDLAIAATDADKDEGDSGTTAFTFTVDRTGDTSGATDVNYNVSGADVDGTDFDGGALPSGTVSFTAGQTTSETITVDVVGDATAEPDETFTVTLSNPTNGATITTASADGIIRNDDVDTSLPFAENFDGSGLGTFSEVSVTGSFTWEQDTDNGNSFADINAFDNDTATPDEDWLVSPAFDLSGTSNEELSVETQERFEGPNLELLFSTDYTGSGDPNNATWTELVGDEASTPEFDDTSTGSTFSAFATTVVSLPAAAASASTVYFAFRYEADGSGGNSEHWRVDDFEVKEVTGTNLTIAATDADKDEGDSGTTAFTFTVDRTGDTSGATDVNYNVSGADVDGTDFDGGALPSGTVSFTAGQTTSETITVDVVGDATAEPDETFTVTLSNPTNGATITTASADGIIRNDDVDTSLPFAENFDGSGLGTFSEVSVTGSFTWEQDTDNGNSFADINAFDNDTATPDEDWLVSPAFDLSGTSNEELSVETQERFEGPNLELLFSTDYTGSGDPNNATWTELVGDEASTPEFDDTSTGSTFSAFATTVVSLPAAAASASTVYFAFRYEADGSGGNSEHWRVDDFEIRESTTPPSFVSAEVNSTTLTITYDETLDASSVPAGTDFTVTGGTSGEVTVSSVSITGTDVALTLASAVQSGETVTLDYTPGTTPIRDASGNDAASLSGENVTNNTSAPTPNLVINEILADPDPSDGDSNGDGTVDTQDDEFVEIVNIDGASVDISDWTVSDGVGVRHTFPANTVLADGEAIVVFGGGMPSAAFGGAVVQTASTGLTGFNNGGDTVTLKDASGTVVAESTYGSEGGNDEALTRDPDLTGEFVQHTSATGSSGALFSPGTQVDGTPFSGASGPFATTIIGQDNPPEGNDRGFRMLAFPTAFEATTLEDDLDFTVSSGSILQTFPGGANGDPWTEVTDLSTTIERGQGFILFFFDDSTDPLESDGIQLDVPNNGERQTEPFTTPTLPANDEFQVLGNPFDEAFDLSEGLPDLTTTEFGATVAVWNGDLGQYELITQGDPDDQVPAFNGFVIQRTTVGAGASDATLTFDPAGKTGSTGDLIGTQSALRPATSNVRVVELQMEATDGSTTSRSTARLRLADNGTVTSDWDAYDFGALPPPASSNGYALAGFPLPHNGATPLRAVASEPYAPNATIDIDLPLHVESVGLSGTATLRWPEEKQTPDYVPADWNVGLVDTAPADGSGTVIHDLRAEGTYTFDLASGNAIGNPSEARFRLRITAGPLPVELARFDAAQVDNGIRLQWQTVSETNNAGFEVQRRVIGDGITAHSDSTDLASWEGIGFVEGAGTTTKTQTYRFRDTDVPFNASGLRYRLRQVDVDGAVSYSDVQSVKAPLPQATTLHTPFPNPASHGATLRYELPEPTDVEIRIYDLLGRQAQAVTTEQQPAGRHEVRIPTGRLAPGAYFVRMTTGTSVYTKRLTIVR